MKNIGNCVKDVASLESGVSTLQYIVYCFIFMFSLMNDAKKCRICVIFVVRIILEVKNIRNCVEDVASLESGVSTLEYIVY